LNEFIGTKIILELMTMRQVGVMVDRDPLPPKTERGREETTHPYLAISKVENIRNFVERDEGVYQKLLLSQWATRVDRNGLPVDKVEIFKFLELTPDGVKVSFYNKQDQLLLEPPYAPRVIELDFIPFHIFEISESLLTDLSDYQISLANLAASDMNLAVKANFPFLVMQYDPIFDRTRQKEAVISSKDQTTVRDQTTIDLSTQATKDGSAEQHRITGEQVSQVGSGHGIRYPKGMDAPAFINPDPESLTASRKFSGELEEDINILANIALSNVEPRRQTEGKKKMDEGQKEEGLSYIGTELQFGENKIGSFWSKFEEEESKPSVAYPQNYSLKSEADRLKEAEALREETDKIPSKTFQKAMAKRRATILVGHHIGPKDLAKIHSEIEKAPVMATDADTIATDIESNLVGEEMASEIRGYPPGQVEKARGDHAKRVQRINAAQGPASRGDKDDDDDPKKSGPAEKKLVEENRDKDPANKPTQRGEGK
jgi:hypothetical protein